MGRQSDDRNLLTGVGFLIRLFVVLPFLSFEVEVVCLIQLGK